MAVIVGVFLAKLLSPIVALGGLAAGWFARTRGNLTLAILGVVMLEEIVLRAVSMTRSYAPAGIIMLSCILAAAAAMSWSLVPRYIRRRRSASG